ncbi:MAG TPA: SpoVA/SpoVAEb family sporulation membrane protein [Clostridia bacterium]|nr:SpoVA/SpoVAEb family sporulation membrane protein [Clostridia bacterium]
MDFRELLAAFIIGGLFCAAAQLVLDGFKLNPAYVMVLFVSMGSALSALGLYQPLVDLGGAGATVPLPGFGHLLTQGVLKDIASKGPWGLFSGGFGAASAGIAAAIVFGYLMSVLFVPKG